MKVNGISNMGIGCNPQFGKQKGIAEANVVSTSGNAEIPRDKQISEEEQQKKAQEFWAFHDDLWAKQTAAAISKVGEGQAVAIEIARRMSGGNKVSEADEKTLMGYDPNMYAAAKGAQMMAERLKDMSEDSLTDKFYEKHKNDRTDWTSELSDKIAELNNRGADAGAVGDGAVPKIQVSESSIDAGRASIDISV